MTEFIAFLGIFIGVLLRTLLPAMRKMLEAPPEEPFKWDHKYTAIAIIAVVLAVFVTLMAYPGFTPPGDGGFLVFIQALLHGVAANELLNEAQSWLGSPSLHGSKT